MKVYKRICVLGFSLLAACGAPQTLDSRVQAERDNDTQDALGTGYDVLAEEVRNECVVVTPLEQQPSIGQPVEFSVTRITTNDALNKSMGVSAAAYLKAGINKGKAKAKFAQSLSINAYSSYIQVNVKVSKASFEMRGVKIKDDAIATYLRSPEDFRNECGDEFVSGYVAGGEYNAILRIDSKNSEEKSEIDTYISENEWSFKDKDKFKSAIGSLSEKYKSMKVFSSTRSGTSLLNLIPTSADEMLTQALEFPETVTTGEAHNYRTLTKKYSSLTLPSGKPFVDTAASEGEIERLAQARAANMDILNNISFIEENPLQFESSLSSVAQTSQLENKAIGNITKVNKATRDCFSDYAKCLMPDLESLPGTLTLPRRKAKNQTINAVSSDFNMTNANGNTWTYLSSGIGDQSENLSLLSSFLSTGYWNTKGMGWIASPQEFYPSAIIFPETVSPSNSAGTVVTLPANTLMLHPGPSRKVVARWTTDRDRSIQAEFRFEDVEPCGNGVEWSVVLRAATTTPDAAAQVLSSGIIDATVSGKATSGGRLLKDIVVPQGRSIDFIVDPLGEHFCDVTFLTAKLSGF